MNNLEMLKRQHREVDAIVKAINTMISDDPESKANDIAFQINALSGKLKMHLMSEDKYLYPELMHSDNQEVRNTAQNFNQEMGGLAELLGSFVQQYNTPFKILQSENSFLTDSRKIFSQIEERIRREDGKLYPLAEN